MRTLYRNKSKCQKIEERFYVLDVETNGSGANPEAFVFCCLFGKDFKEFFYSVEDIRCELLKHKYKNKTIFVHFAEFDLNVIYENIISELDNAAIYAGSQFISATNGNCRFADSMNIYRTSVKEIGKSIGLEKMDMPNKFKKGEKYEINAYDLTYCARDCEIVFEALKKIFIFTGGVKLTIASLALHLFKTKYMRYDIDYNENYTDLFYQSYYGGRTEAFKIGKTFAFMYDVISMYPFNMLKDFPNPKKFLERKNVDIDTFNFICKYHEGIAWVELFHVEHYFGFLPVKHNGKLIFPVGNLNGCWNLCELRFALEHNIIKIKKVHKVCYSPTILESPFNEYVNDLIQIKETSTGIDRLNAKLFLNSLYGKFAEKIHYKKTYFDCIPDQLIQQYDELKIPYKIYLFNKERFDCFIEILEEPEDKQKQHVIALFASYITSYSRIELLKQLLKWQDNVPVYVDTDSIAIEKIDNSHICNNKLGEFKQETKVITEIKGLKNYEYIDYSKSALEIDKKLKGVPLHRESTIQLSEDTYQYEQIIKAKSGIRRLIITGNTLKVLKKITNNYDKRKIIDIFGNTKPIKL